MSKDKLEELYWGQNMSQSQIAKLYGVNLYTIFRGMHKLGVPTRKSGHHPWTEERKRDWSRRVTGEGNPMYGKPTSLGKKHSEETKEKIRQAHLGMRYSAETRERVRQSKLGKKWSEEEKLKRSRTQKGRKQSKEWIAKRAEARGKYLRQNPPIGKLNPFYGKHHTEETKRLIIQGQRKSMALKPNKAESLLDSVLQEHFPGKWKYVGDGQVIIGGRCPDFINVDGKKQLIELFGTYWHGIFDMAKKVEHYRSYGFDVLIIWEDELKNSESVIRRVKKFSRGPKKK